MRIVCLSLIILFSFLNTFAQEGNGETKDPMVEIGDILCTDGSFVKPDSWPSPGKTAKAVVFYVDNTGQHGWAVNLTETNNIAWCSEAQYGHDIASLPNIIHSREAIYDFNGLQNTQKIRAEGNADDYPAAWAVDIANGWYLPASGQIRLLYSHILLVNSTLAIVNGTQLFRNDSFIVYWTSNENSSRHARVMVSSGNESIYPKTAYFGDYNYTVRAIRSF